MPLFRVTKTFILDLEASDFEDAEERSRFTGLNAWKVEANVEVLEPAEEYQPCRCAVPVCKAQRPVRCRFTSPHRVESERANACKNSLDEVLVFFVAEEA